MAKLKFYYGVMGAGKTTELLKTYTMYDRKGLNPVIIKPSIDDREGKYNGWGTTKSRLSKDSEPAFYYTNLKQDINKLNFNTLFIDEAQFMTREDVLFITELVDKKNINVLAYGLKTDINGHLFPGAEALLALSDETKELEALCETPGCQNKATLHLRYINNKVDTSNNSVAIEKDDVKYKSVCRKCWILAKNKSR